MYFSAHILLNVLKMNTPFAFFLWGWFCCHRECSGRHSSALWAGEICQERDYWVCCFRLLHCCWDMSELPSERSALIIPPVALLLIEYVDSVALLLQFYFHGQLARLDVRSVCPFTNCISLMQGSFYSLLVASLIACLIWFSFLGRQVVSRPLSHWEVCNALRC